MNRRIEKIITESGIRKVDFARRLNLSQPYISELCSGKTAPSDRTIGDICREFNVREQWLRTGEGEMFNPVNRDEEIMAFMASALSADGDTAKFQKRFLTVLSRLTIEEWKLIQDKIKELQAED